MSETGVIDKVVRAVAAVDGSAPEELEPLYEYIDPEVLEKLSRQTNTEWSLSFQYADHRVTVNHETEVVVDGAERGPDS